jgi:hypothetical protein
MTMGSSMQAMIFTDPWHCSHSVMSIWNTRFRRRAQSLPRHAVSRGHRRMALHGRAFIRICGWFLDSLAPFRRGDANPVLAVGAKTPWKRVRCTRGFGARAASRAINCLNSWEYHSTSW